MLHRLRLPRAGAWLACAFWRLVLALATLLQPGVLPAQRPVTLDELVARAMRDNLDARSARLRLDAARADWRAARGVPNPVFSVSPQSPYQYILAAPLDVGPQRTYRVRAGRDGADAATSDVRDAERLVRFAVRAGYFDLLLADSLREVARGEREFFRALLASDSARVRSGDAPERNLAKSELELAKADAGLSQAEASVRAASMALQIAAGISHPDTGFRVEGAAATRPLPRFDDRAVDSLLALRPDVQAARQRVTLGEDARALAAAQLVPVPQLSLVHQPDGPFPNGQHLALGVGVQVPLWNWLGGERARADAARDAARLDLERVEAQARADIAVALDQYRATSRLAARFDAGLLATSRRALETAQYAYAAGALSYVDLLDAIRTYGEVRADAAQAQHDAWVSAFAVARALGRDEDFR